MTTCNSLTLIKLYLPQCASDQSEHQIKLLERFVFMPIAHVHPYFWHCMIFHCCTWNTLCCKFLPSFKITVNFNTKNNDCFHIRIGNYITAWMRYSHDTFCKENDFLKESTSFVYFENYWLAILGRAALNSSKSIRWAIFIFLGGGNTLNIIKQRGGA